MLVSCLGKGKKLSLLCLGLIIHLCVSAQVDGWERSIQVDVYNVPLKQVLKSISKSSGIQFSYNPRKIEANRKVTFSGSTTVESIVNEIANLLNLEYEFVGGQVILKKAMDNSPITVSGYVRDAGNGEALIGATVYIDTLKIGATTNVHGYYSFTIPNGNYPLTYSFIGYEPIIINYTSERDIPPSIELNSTPSVLEEIVIASSNILPLDDVQMSEVNMNPSQVAEMPALMGEVDVVKSLEFIPGIKPHSDGSTFFYVRGGNRDQNMIMVDDAPIYNSSHMLGIFSTVIPDAVNDVTIYKGDMPASLGGRISSVIDIRTKKGNDKKTEVWGSHGLIASNLGVEGPIKKEKSAYMVSTRFSRIKWIFKENNPELEQLNFYDFTGKLNFKSDSKNNVFTSFYIGRDKFIEANSGIEWANQAGTVQWNHIFNSKLFLNTTIAASAYDYYLHIDKVNNTKWKSHVANIDVKADFTYFKNPENIYTFGAAINGHNFNPGNLTTDLAEVQPPLVSIKNAFETVLYAEHEVKLDDKLSFRYGLRITNWSNLGGAFEFQFDGNHNPIDTLFFGAGEVYNEYSNLEPRVGINYAVSDISAIKFSATRNVQNHHLITNSISPFTSLEVWLPSSLNIRPQIANQMALGYSKLFPERGMSLTIEGYIKKMRNQIDYVAHAETMLNTLLEGELRFGSSNAQGLEVLVKKPEGRISGWFGYTYSRVRRIFPEINNGQPYNAFYDRPHDVNLVLSYSATERMNLGLSWSYYSGSAVSSPVGFYKYNGLEIPIYGQKNNDRLPDYHRLDLSATWKLNKNIEARYKHDLIITLFNVYGRRNTLFINYNKKETEPGVFKIPANLLENSRTTSQFYLFRFTPSVTYRFRFK